MVKFLRNFGNGGVSSSSARWRRLLSVVGAMTLGVMIAVSAPATAATDTEPPPDLQGKWAPLDRCPVDDPAMLAADGSDTVALCLSSTSFSGSMTIGDMTVPTKRVNLQFGLVRSAAGYTIVPPEGGAIQAEPVRVPGGLLGLMCPADIPLVSQVCHLIQRSDANTVMATVVPAGEPSDFSFAAGVGVGKPILSLPVKIHLENPFLSDDCYIGSKENPIVLQPANLARPSGTFVTFDAEGNPTRGGAYGYIQMRVSAQGDDSFAVPKAHGCGLGGLLNMAINAKLGLPSPSGNNSLVLNSAVTRIGGHALPGNFAPNQGQALADAWHAAVIE